VASEPSFDIVSEIDLQEVDNAVNQGSKEIHSRYDFKGSNSSFAFERDQKKVIILAADDMKLRAMKDILLTKGAKRNISPKAFKFKDAEPALGGSFRQEVELVFELPQETAKAVVKWIKELKLKVQASIQGEKVRVSGKKKDDLQAVQAMLRARPVEVPLQFVNYRG
jgi:uncharacterized protein YajQ (UPF0234 family)